MPSHDIHLKYATLFLRSRRVIPDKSKVRFVDLLIDDPKSHAPKIQELVRSNFNLWLCIAQELSPHDLYMLLKILPTLGHDVLTQRFSPKRTSWSRSMISYLRQLIGCIFGREYGLLVDLHVLLDMAEKWCCDDELLRDWGREVGISPEILDYYAKHRALIDYDLNCTIRLKQGKCSRRDVARWLRFNESTEST